MNLSEEQLRSKIFKINKKLRAMKMSWKQIETFWHNCIAEAKARDLEVNFEEIK